MLQNISNDFKLKTQAQLQSHRLKFEKSKNPRNDDSVIIETILGEYEKLWNSIEDRLKIIHGKDFLASLNSYLQKEYKITITNSNIINSISNESVPNEMKDLINKIEQFRKELVTNNKA